MDTLHTFMPTIEVSDYEGKDILTYQSLIMPKIGEWVSYKDSKGFNMQAKISQINHEIVQGNVVNICKRIFVTVDDIESV
jgi:hypothetical protein